MPRVELIYDLDCPNLRSTREALLRGFARAGLRPAWVEWDRKSPDSPSYVRRYGSPTVLVDGRDVAGAEPGDDSDSCRIYIHHPREIGGVPPVSGIASALGRAGPSARPRPVGRKSGWWRWLASFPGLGAVLLPVGACPACWPAYAGVLGAFGLGFLLESRYLLPVTLALLGLALFALAFRAGTRRGYGPFLFGSASVLFILVFKFVHPFDPPVYAGLLGLLAASVWNGWPKRRGKTGSCPKCVQGEPAMKTRNAP